MKYAFPGSPWGLVHCFLVLESRLGKLALKSEDGHYARFSIGKETLLRRRAYLCIAFNVCIKAAFKLQVKCLLTWMRNDKHTYVHTCIQTHTLFVKQFQKTWFKNYIILSPYRKEKYNKKLQKVCIPSNFSVSYCIWKTFVTRCVKDHCFRKIFISNDWKFLVGS